MTLLLRKRKIEKGVCRDFPRVIEKFPTNPGTENSGELLSDSNFSSGPSRDTKTTEGLSSFHVLEKSQLFPFLLSILPIFSLQKRPYSSLGPRDLPNF